MAVGGLQVAKDEKYFCFKGHIVITQEDVTKAIDVAAANIDERDVLPELKDKLHGDLIADILFAFQKLNFKISEASTGT